MKLDPKSLFVSPDTKILEVMDLLNREQKGIALVVDEEARLLGTVTDGDIRRAVLKGAALDDQIQKAMQHNAIVAPMSLPVLSLRHLMTANDIRHLPLVDEAGRVVSLEYTGREQPLEAKLLTAVIMAGGEGKRLRPLTEDIPKPMLKVGDQPVLEILINLLRQAGFHRILISVGYLREVIQDYFKDGADWGLDIHYIIEEQPLGTAGALSLIPDDLKPTQPFLVVNGDLLTRLPFDVFHDFHMATGYDFTMCCRPYEVDIPFGYPVLDGDLVIDFKEKPTFHYLVNSGIYCLSPNLLDQVPSGTFFNMTDLIEKVSTGEGRVGVFPLREPFYEIGQVEAYEKAEAFYREHFEGREVN